MKMKTFWAGGASIDPLDLAMYCDVCGWTFRKLKYDTENNHLIIFLILQMYLSYQPVAPIYPNPLNSNFLHNVAGRMKVNQEVQDMEPI